MAAYNPTMLSTFICFLTLLRIAHCSTVFSVEGQVYCDTCRVRFLTRLSEFMQGAEVRLECREKDGGSLTYSLEGKTNAKGEYHLEVEGEHDEETCEVVLAKSSRDDCNQFAEMKFGKHSAKINLVKDDGIASTLRLANPLGFYKNDPLPECPKLLNELEILPSDIND